MAPQPGLVRGVLHLAEKKLQELLRPREGGLTDSGIQMVTPPNISQMYSNPSSLFRFALTDKQFKLTHINLNYLYYYDGFEEAD